MLINVNKAFIRGYMVIFSNDSYLCSVQVFFFINVHKSMFIDAFKYFLFKRNERSAWA